MQSGQARWASEYESLDLHWLKIQFYVLSLFCSPFKKKKRGRFCTWPFLGYPLLCGWLAGWLAPSWQTLVFLFNPLRGKTQTNHVVSYWYGINTAKSIRSQSPSFNHSPSLLYFFLSHLSLLSTRSTDAINGWVCDGERQVCWSHSQLWWLADDYWCSAGRCETVNVFVCVCVRACVCPVCLHSCAKVKQGVSLDRWSRLLSLGPHSSVLNSCRISVVSLYLYLP